MNNLYAVVMFKTDEVVCIASSQGVTEYVSQMEKTQSYEIYKVECGYLVKNAVTGDRDIQLMTKFVGNGPVWQCG